jgi:hypothetical protein
MFAIVQGDLVPQLLLTCTVNGLAEDLSGDFASAVLEWTKPGGTIVEVALATVDLTQGSFSYTWQAGDTDIVGTHLGRVRVTHVSGAKVQHFPSNGTRFSWVVAA